MSFNRYRTMSLVGILIGLTIVSAHAQSFRCKNDLVNVGDAPSSVIQKCGEPLHKHSFCKPNQDVLNPNPATATVCESI
jgi:hypothetical protein